MAKVLYSSPKSTRRRSYASKCPRERVEAPYRRAKAWFTQDPAERPKLSRSRLSDYRRIRDLGDLVGGDLDKLGATYAVVRWVAGPARLDPLARDERARAAIAALRAGEVTKTRLAELAEAHAAFGPHGRARRVEAEPVDLLELLTGFALVSGE